MFSGRFQRKSANCYTYGVLRFSWDIPEATIFWKLQPQDDYGYKNVLLGATNYLLDKAYEFLVSFHEKNNSISFYKILRPILLFFSMTKVLNAFYVLKI